MADRMRGTGTLGATKQNPAPLDKCVEASTIEQGECFRKRTGSYVYLRIAPASMEFYGLDPEDVFGVCFNGNMCNLRGDTLVVPMPPSAMSDNRAEFGSPSVVKGEHKAHGEPVETERCEACFGQGKRGSRDCMDNPYTRKCRRCKGTGKIEKGKPNPPLAGGAY